MQPLFVKRQQGMPGCGQALTFASGAANSGAAVIPDHPLWQLDKGSVDLWVRFDTYNDRPMGVISKDAINVDPGHVALLRNCKGRLIVRIQSDTKQAYRCSAPVQLGVWTHVGINFGHGGLQLYVDGVESDPTVKAEWAENCKAPLYTVDCGEPWSDGLLNNKNPWVLGGLTKNSTAGTTDNVVSPLTGAIDSLRISKITRRFDKSTR